LKIKQGWSKAYDFMDPDEKKWKVWEDFFTDFILDLTEKAREVDVNLSVDENFEEEFQKVGAFLITFFKRLYFMKPE
jgi:hypothetical protein